MAGKDHAAALDSNQPLLIVANHTNWWDGFTAHYLHYRLLPKRRMFLAQSEKFLRSYSFFTFVGVFGLDNERSPLSGLRHAIALLQDHRNAVWFFPQGKIHHPDTRINGPRGAAFLAAKASAQILPIAFRYEWLVESRPTILARIGQPLQPGTPQDAIHVALQNLVDETRRCLDPILLEKFEPMMPPRLSLNKRWDWCVAALRGQLAQFKRDNLQ